MKPIDRQTLAPEQFARVRAIFEAALERPTNERRAYAAGACAGDAELLKVVEGMLAAEDHTNTLLPRNDASASSSSTHEEGRFPAGTVLAGRYKILGLLGRGGMGEVYKAFDQILNQVVALKFLSPTHVSEAALVRFRNEVRIARQVSHSNVCRVYDLGMVEGLHFLSMEFIDGEDLASLLRRIGRLPQDKAIEFTRKICAGLAAAHERGVLHRDLKPANIMIDGRGQPRITDFGLAGLQQEIPLSDLRSGTPAYMSPEQKAGKEVTTRSDIYALGLVLHEMFTGKQHGAGTQTNPSDFVKDLDPAIERLILRCLEEDPGRRPQTALRVAMGLPGADPIAAALAAGETPSPEMVAASQEKEGFSSRTAIFCYLLLLLAFSITVAWQSRTSLAAKAPMVFPPDAMAEKARQVIRSAGYDKLGKSIVYGYACCEVSRALYVGGLPHAQQREALSTHRPAISTFYYRQADGTTTTDLFPEDGPRQQGSIRIELDGVGRLNRLEVSPDGDDLPTTGSVQWLSLFESAGLDPSRFTAVPADPRTLIPTQEQFAWEGDWGANRPERVRVDAGSRGRRAVLFHVKPQIPTVPVPFRYWWVEPLQAFIAAVIALGALTAAFRNSREGRQDRRGAFLLTAFTAISTALFIALAPRHINLAGPVPFYVVALVVAVWPFYVSAEPQVRRNWPDALISWSRFSSGSRRNGLVASHVLAGATLALAIPAVTWVVVEWGAGPVPYWVTTLQGLAFVGSSTGMVSLWAFWATTGLATGLALLFTATQLRLAIRKLWLADIIAGLPLAFLFTGPAPDLFLVAGMWLLDLWLLRRLGFLAFISAWILQTAMIFLTYSATGWIAPYTIGYHLVPVLIGTWALWVILTEKRPGKSTESAT